MMEVKYMPGTIPISAELIMVGVIYFVIYWLTYAIGKYAQAWTVQEPQENTSEQDLTIISGSITSGKD
jgi:hypothetical protein